MGRVSKIHRRDFLSQLSCIGGAATLGSVLPRIGQEGGQPQAWRATRISQVKQPLAIAMWDYSWLLKHHRYGAFENWDEALDGLVKRGYNAIRIDCFPHLIAADRAGKVQESYMHKKTKPGKVLWGHDYSITTTPRASLASFLRKCRDRHVHVGLATWFMEQGTGRTKIFSSQDDFVRAWDETLAFIKSKGLMDVVCYVDLLNEYPLWHGFEWLQEQLNQRGDVKLFEKNNPDANVPNELFAKKGRFNGLQTRFYQEFMSQALQQLRAKWPALDIFACETGGILAQDYKHHGALDKHFWFTHHPGFAKGSGFSWLTRAKTDHDITERYRKGLEVWRRMRPELSKWMEGQIQQVAIDGKKHGIPVGNTEGWGAVFWDDHPGIDWTFIKEAAELAVPLALKHGYRFVCTSNFCEPQFRGMWEDLAWHRRMTKTIKAGG